MNTHNLIANLFSASGEPTLESYVCSRDLEKNCSLASGPHSFHLTIDVRHRPAPSIKWTCNTDLHFGITHLSYEDYLMLIKPEWLPIYNGFGMAAYRLASERMTELASSSVTYTVKVPLRQMNGGYYWYNQVSRPCEFDDRGNMVSHISSYHRMAPYSMLQPGQPIVTIDERQNAACEAEIQRSGSKALTGLLFNGLRPREFEVLYHYRRFAARAANAGRHLTSGRLAKKMKIQIHGINKHNTRVLTAARLAFPASRFNTVEELAGFLNLLFGPPARGKHV